MILRQFPFLFLSVLLCFLFPRSRREKLETKAVSWAVFTYEDARKCQGNKGAQDHLLFPLLFDGLSFRFCFRWTPLGVE